MTETSNSITVTGHGAVQTAPDFFTINIGIEASQPAVRDAYAEAGGVLNAVHTRLLTLGVDRTAISSSSVDVRMDSRWQEGVGTVVTGYTVSSTLSVSLRYDQGAQDIVSAVIETGNNNVRLNGMSPVVSDPSAAQDKARAAAWADARRAADVYAQLAGCTLGAVEKVHEGNITSGGPHPLMARAAMGMDSSMPIEPGQNDVSIAVQITWSLN